MIDTFFFFFFGHKLPFISFFFQGVENDRWKLNGFDKRSGGDQLKMTMILAWVTGRIWVPLSKIGESRQGEV